MMNNLQNKKTRLIYTHKESNPSISKFRYSVFQARGKKPTQEDAFFSDGYTFSIFDGHGGGEVSAFLQNKWHDFISNKAKDSSDLTNCDKVNKIFQDLQESVTNEMNRLAQLNEPKRSSYFNFNEVGSTLISLFRDNDFLYSINVGDSRAIALSKGGNILQLSRDHSATDQVEKNRIRNLGGHVITRGLYDSRVEGVYNLTRAIGDIGFDKYMFPYPDVRKVAIKNLEFVILACDGLWETLTHEDAIEIVKTSLKKGTALSKIPQKLVKKSFQKGSRDNLTAIVILID